MLVTPPCFDDQRAKKSFSYNSVLDRYAERLLAQRDKGWLVVDLHGPMAREVVKRRESDPDFTFQPDAVHPNVEGHWFVPRQLIGWFGNADAMRAESPQTMLVAHQTMVSMARSGRADLRTRISYADFVSLFC